MTRFAPLVLVAGLALGGCAESLAALGGSLVSGVGAGVSESYEAKKDAIARWKIEKERLVAKVSDRMEMAADQKFAAGEYEAGLAMLKAVIVFHDDQQPLWLIQKYIRRKQEEPSG